MPGFHGAAIALMVVCMLPHGSDAQPQVMYSTRQFGSNVEIVSSRLDGSLLRRLTNHTANDQKPRVSVTGDSIVFVSNRSGQFRVHIMRSDGSDVQQVSSTICLGGQNWGWPGDPEWTPDGKILFNAGNLLYRVNPDGTGQTLLWTCPANRGVARIVSSHRGDKIAVQTVASWSYISEIYLLNPDGSGATLFVPDDPGALFLCDFSRSGEVLLYARDVDGHEESSGAQWNDQLFHKHLATSVVTPLSGSKPNLTLDVIGIYTLDDSQIIFNRDSIPAKTAPLAQLHKGITRINQDGSNRRDILYDPLIWVNDVGPGTQLIADLRDTVVCAGESGILSVDVTAFGRFASSNVYQVQLSDASGSFTFPLTVGSLADTASCTISCTIPPSLSAGTGYRVRVISTVPKDTSAASVQTLEVRQSPRVNAGTDTSVCAPYAAVRLGRGVSQGVWPFTFQWMPVNGLSNPTDSSVLASPNATTTYVCTVTDALGCIGKDTVTITVHTRPVVDAGPDTCLCDGGAGVRIGNSVTSGTPPFTHVWTPAAGLDNPNAAQPTARPAVTTAYTVIVTDVNGCTAADTVLVCVETNPVASISGRSRLCQGDSLVLTAGAATGVTHAWVKDGILIPGANSSQLTVREAGAYQVILSNATTGLHCSDTSAVHTVTLAVPPVATIAGDTTLCSGSSVLLTATTGSGWTWQWFRDGTPLTGATASTLVASSAGRYTVLVTSADTCRDSSVVHEIREVSPPLSGITGERVVCPGSTHVYVADSTAGWTYTWTVIGGSIVGGQHSHRISVVWSAPDSGRVQLSGQFRGCPFDTVFTVHISSTLVPRITRTPPVLCPGGSVTLSTESSHAQYRWSTPDSATTRTITITRSGRYSVWVRDSAGCEGTAFIDIPDRILQRVRIDATIPDPLCEGDTVTLVIPGRYSQILWSTGDTTLTVRVWRSGWYTARVFDDTCWTDTDTVHVLFDGRPRTTLAGPLVACSGSRERYHLTPLPGGTYQWSVIGGVVISRTVSADTVEIEWGATGTGAVRVTVRIPGNPCPGEASMDIVIRTAPVPQISGDTVICSTSEAEIRLLGFETFDGIRWSTGDTTRSIRVRQSGTYHVEVRLGSCTGRSASTTVTVRDTPHPSIHGADSILFLCEDSVLTLTLDGQYNSVLWSTGERTAGITVDSAGIYIVTVTDAYGCTANDTAVVVAAVTAGYAIDGIASACIDREREYRIDSTHLAAVTWDVTGGIIIEGQGTARCRVRWTVEGVQTIRAVITDRMSGCPVLRMLRVTVGVALDPDLRVDGIPIRSDTTIRRCVDDVVTFTAAEGFSSYHWTGVSASGPRASVTVTAPGAYSVAVTDAQDCTGNSPRVTLVAVQPPSPKLTASGSRVLCLGDSLIVCLDRPYREYRWSTGETTPCITARSSGRYTVDVLDDDGCPGNSDTLDITTLPPVPPRIIGAGSACPSGLYYYSCTADSSAQVRWQVAGGSIIGDSTASVIRIQWGGIGTGSIVVTVTHSACVYTTSFTVSIDTTFTPMVEMDGTPCEGQSIRLRVPDVYRAYRWSTGDSTAHVTVSRSGRYSVIVRDENDCVGTASIDVVFVPAPVARVTVAGGNAMLCDSDSTVLCIDGVTGAYSVLWSHGDTSRCAVIRQPGLYHAVVRNSNGCESRSDSVIITMRASPVRTINGRTVACSGDTIMYTASSDSGIVSRWEVYGGTSIGSVDTDTVRVRWTSPGPGTVRLVSEYRTSPRCTAYRDLPVSVASSTITPVISATSTTRCTAQADTLCAPPNFDSYLWMPSLDTTQCIIVTHAAAGTYTYTVTVTSGSCSGTSDPFSLIVRNPPIVRVREAGLDLCPGRCDVLHAPPGYHSYEWFRDGLRLAGVTSDSLEVCDPGVYSVLVRDTSGCDGRSQDVLVTRLPVTVPTVTRNGYRLTSSPARSYQWYRNGLLLPGESGQVLIAQDSGAFVVCTIDMSGCAACSDPVRIDAAEAMVALECPQSPPFPVGTRVIMPLDITSRTSGRALPGTRYSFTIILNNRVLLPDFPALPIDRELGLQRYRVYGTIGSLSASSFRFELPFIALWGDTACTDVRIDSLTWEGEDWAVTYGATSCLICVELCDADGERRFITGDGMQLLQNSPNPFNHETSITYELIEASETEIIIHDVHGRLVSRHHLGFQQAGWCTTRLDAMTLRSGMYFYTLRSAGGTITRRMEVLR